MLIVKYTPAHSIIMLSKYTHTGPDVMQSPYYIRYPALKTHIFTKITAKSSHILQYNIIIYHWDYLLITKYKSVGNGNHL